MTGLLTPRRMTEDFDSMVSQFLDVCGSDNLTAQYAVEEGMKRNSDIDAIIAHYFDAGCPRAPPDYLGPSFVAHGSKDSKIPDENRWHLLDAQNFGNIILIMHNMLDDMAYA